MGWKVPQRLSVNSRQHSQQRHLRANVPGCLSHRVLEACLKSSAHLWLQLALLQLRVKLTLTRLRYLIDAVVGISQSDLAV